MATTADMRSGLILKIDNSLYTVIEFGQNKTARAAAKVWAKLKGVDNARTIEVEQITQFLRYPPNHVHRKTHLNKQKSGDYRDKVIRIGKYRKQ